MKDINIYNIQISDIELFLSVAKYGSFTKASEKMFVSQPWVSKRIEFLERELDLSLFIRNKRSVTLTPAGRVLAERFERITDRMIDAIRAAHVAQTGASGYLRIGFLEWGDIAFAEKLKAFMDARPQFDVDIFRMSFPRLRADLTDNRLDIIVTTSYDCIEFENGEYTILPLKTVPLTAYMSPDNPLASKDQLVMDDLRGQMMLMVDQKSSPGFGKFMQEIFAKHSFSPHVMNYAHDGGEHIGNLLLGKGVLLASECFLMNTFEDQIARVPLQEETVDICAIWKNSNENPVLKLYLQEVLRA